MKNSKQNTPPLQACSIPMGSESADSKSTSLPSFRRKPESRGFSVVVGSPLDKDWMPACAGMTDLHFA